MSKHRRGTPGHRVRAGGLAITILAAISVCAGSTLIAGAGHASAAGTSVWLQTMDSCRQALGGASYQVVNSSSSFSETVATPSGAPRSVGSGACPLPRGNCASVSTGCVQLPNLAYPGSYKVREVRTPPANRSNPQGYVPCNGGSACRAEWADLSIDALGRVASVTTNIEPDGTVQHYPGSGSASGAASDPVLFHDFGLGSGSCDGDGDADDHLTGSPSSHCQYPESEEASACQPYPSSCSASSGGATSSSPPSSTSSGGRSRHTRHTASRRSPSSPSSHRSK
jgi:hypothetical protein